MVTEIFQKLIMLIIGLLFASSAVIIFFRAKNVNYTERKQIFKTAEYFNACIILTFFLLTYTSSKRY